MLSSNQPWCTTESSTENGIEEELSKAYETPVYGLFGRVIEGTEITTVAQANEAHHRINGLFLDALGLGKFLVEQKEKVGHSNWEQWVKDELEFTSRTAGRYMLLYKERNQFATEQIGHGLSDLSMTKALKILSGNKKREKAKIATKKETATIISTEQTNDSKRAYLSGGYVSRSSYKQFADAIELLKSIDPKDYRYSEWIKILEGVIRDMKARRRTTRCSKRTVSKKRARSPLGSTCGRALETMQDHETSPTTAAGAEQLANPGELFGQEPKPEPESVGADRQVATTTRSNH
jgi:hypothetical protein